MISTSPRLDALLAPFTGSEVFYRHPLGSLIYTEGIRYMAQSVEAYWLLDVVASHLLTNPTLRRESFQLWRIELDGQGALVEAWTDTPGAGDLICSQSIPYTDFPCDFEWYVVWNGLDWGLP